MRVEAAEYDAMAGCLEEQLRGACPLVAWRVSRFPFHAGGDDPDRLMLFETDSFSVTCPLAIHGRVLELRQRVTRELVEDMGPGAVRILVDNVMAELARERDRRSIRNTEKATRYEGGADASG